MMHPHGNRVERQNWIALVLFQVLGFVFSVFIAPAPSQSIPSVYNVRLVTDSTPDLTDIPSYLRSITSQYDTPQDRAIAIWRWSQKMRKQASNPVENGHEVMDPIILFNSYGHCNCGIVSGLNNTMWLNMGWRAHYVQLGDHTVCETSWDDGKTWHMFDASMSFYCFNDAGQVASVTEIENNPRFYLENFAPECGTNPVSGIDDHQGWRQAADRPVQYQRTLANGYDSFKSPNHITEGNLYAQWGQRFVLNLRPNEQYIRNFGHLDAGDLITFRPLPNGTDVEDQHNHRGIRANGIWHYAPDLRAADAAEQVYDASGVKWGDPSQGFAVRATGTEPGTVIFRVSAANVVASAKLALATSRLNAVDEVAVEVSTTAGITYHPVWKCDSIGATIEHEIDLTPFVASASEYFVKVHLSGPGAGLESASIDTLTQINRASLPRLSRGPNRVQLTLGPQVETLQFRPSLVEGNHSATVAEEKLIDVATNLSYYSPTLRPAANNRPGFATWKIATPTPITSVFYGSTVCVRMPNDRLTMLHSWDGKAYTADYEKTTGDEPFDRMVNCEVANVPPDTRTAYLRYEFATQKHAQIYRGPGIQMARMTVEHEPKIKGFTPIEITYCWIEHRDEGDVERQHTERVNTPAYEYTINVGGFRDPTMKWVRLNLQGSSPAGEKVAEGYSDGENDALATPSKRELFQWGKNIAKGSSYSLAGEQSTKNRDAGNDLTDGIIAPPDDYVSEKFMPTNVIFEKDSTAVATLDLGSEQSVAAVRVHAGQEPGFHLAFPATITVEASLDGETFTKIGDVQHHQVFDPPADFQPWENDDSPQYAELPAGGRLAYAYRVILAKPTSARYLRVSCVAQPGWGLLLSEIQALDQVTVQLDVPPPVFLPPLTESTATQKSTRQRP